MVATRNTVSSETAIKIQDTKDWKENILKALRLFISGLILFKLSFREFFFQSFYTSAIFLFVNEDIHGGKTKYFQIMLLLVLKNVVGHFLEAVHWDTERWAWFSPKQKTFKDYNGTSHIGQTSPEHDPDEKFWIYFLFSCKDNILKIFR